MNGVLNFLGGMIFFGLLGLVFFAQFVLPVKKLSDRFGAFQRLIQYMLQAGGPAIFIENGVEKKRRGETKRKGKGVVILDTASGAVLRNDVRFTRVVGPGVVFTGANEYPAGSVDLHRQVWPLPPLGPFGDEDPFEPRRRDESEDAYNHRQARRRETSGLTRDGVEVIPNVLAVFRLERVPGDEGVSFGYNPSAVERWVRADGIARQRDAQKETTKFEKIGEDKERSESYLRKLPAYLAVDVWREYLQKFTLEELFLSPTNHDTPDETGLEVIMKMVRLRLANIQVNDLDNVGNPTGDVVGSEEFQILQDSGIRVEGVSITNLRFKPDVERKLVDGWVSTWLQRAQSDRERIESQRYVESMAGKQKALERFAAAATRRFDQQFLQLPRPTRQEDELIQMKLALERLLRGTLQECALEPRLHQQLDSEMNTLSEMINWTRMQEP